MATRRDFFPTLLASTLIGRPAIARGLPGAPPSHIVVVVMENRGFDRIAGATDAPYINSLAARSALFTQSFGITHPSQPNYLALFSGSTHGIPDNQCPLTLHAPNLAQQLIEAGKSFVGYSEGLPVAGWDGCSTSEGYARKHVPWANFPDLPRTVHQPLSAFPAAGAFARLPTVAFVIPNQWNDMHDGSIARGDAWLKAKLDGYIRWAGSHNALLILTWDEDEGTPSNRIPTLFHGPMVKPGRYDTPINHYSVLRTIEALHGLTFLGEATRANTIAGIW